MKQSFANKVQIDLNLNRRYSQTQGQFIWKFEHQH